MTKNYALNFAPIADGMFINRSGVVISIRQRGVRIRRQSKNWKGYMHTEIGTGLKPKRVGTHRLVLTAFDRDPKPGELAMHKNNIRDDNRIENLKWGTSQENTDQMIADGRDRFPKTSRPHIVIEARSSKLSNAELARKHGVDPSYISHIRAGRRGRHIQ